MARTGTFGGFSFDEEVFAGMMQEEEFWPRVILASGILKKDASIMNLIGEKGNVATIPFYTPFSPYDSGMGAKNNDGETDNTPVSVSGNKQTCMLTQRMMAWKSNDFTAELTGAKPMDFIKQKVTGYYTDLWEMELMNIINAVLGAAELSDHVTDLSVTSGTVADKNKIDETTMIDAEQAALGDMSGGLGMVVMHSKIFASYLKKQLVEYSKYTVGNVIKTEITLPTINGKVVHVNDRFTLDNTVSGFPVYKTFLLGAGSVLTCDKTNYKQPYYTDYDPETAAGVEMLYTKQGKVLHPNGLSLAVDNIAKESPTFAELGTTANWSLKFNHKNVKMGLIKSNG